MANIAGVTKRLATAPVAVTVGTAKNVGSMIKGSVIGSTGISSLRPTNILSATMEAAGIGGLVPATLGAGGAGQGPGIMQRVRSAFTPSPKAPADVTGTTNVRDRGSEGILSKLLDINVSILDVSNKIAANTNHTNELLTAVITGQKSQLLRDIENAREAKTARSGFANDNVKGGDKGKAATGGGGIGAGLMGLLSMIPGFGLLKTIFSAITEAIATIVQVGGLVLRGLLGIGRFLIRFAGPIAAVVALLLVLEAKDWEAFFGRFTDAFKDFMEGRWLEGIVKIVIAIPELIVKGIGRLIARIAEWLGFDKFAKALDEIIDNFDLLAIFKAMFNYVVDTFNNIKDTVVNFFSNAKDAIAEWWNSFSIIDPIIDAFTYVKDLVVNFFGSVKDTVSEWINSAADLGAKIGEYIGNIANNVWEFFKSLPGKLVDAASSLIPDFIKEPFRKLFGTGESRAPAQTSTLPPSTAPTTAPTNTASNTNAPNLSRETRDVAALTGVMNENTPRGTAAAAIKAIDNILAPETQTQLQSTGNQREQAFNAQSARQALESSTSAPPVVINNTNMNAQSGSSGGGGQATAARSSGAAPTAPVESHIDRALYGNAFGAGYA